MAKNQQPIVKRCRALGISPAAMGYTGKTKSESNRNPKGQMRRKQSEYARQLNEKQKVKFVYGILEKQFHEYYNKASKSQGRTGEVLLTTIERRLDNVVFRLGFASTRREARQLVNHGHFTVNGRRCNIPSAQVSVGDVIAVCQKSQASPKFKTLIEEYGKKAVPQWMERVADSFEGKIVALPVREDIDYEVSENLIVELYSR